MIKNKLIKNYLRGLTILTLLISNNIVNAQVDNFRLSVQNLNQTGSNKLEFDVYLLDMDASQPFVLGSCQLGFLINSLISTGSLTVTIDNSTSGLNASQVFTATPTTVVGPSGYPDQTLIRLSSRFIADQSAGATIQTIAPGTLLTHFIITSSVDFVGNSTPNLSINSITTTPSLYPTRVGEFISGLLTQLTVTPGVNAIVNGNPILNPPPSTFTVTGGGSYCQGAGGLPIGLSDSEVGVTYTLYKNTVAQVPTVSGSGSSITFGNQLFGSYTVRGTNAGGTKAMTGTVILTEVQTPEAPTLGPISQPTCVLGTGSIILTGLPTGAWIINPGNIAGSVTSITISGLSAALYTFTVTASGCISAPSANVVINPQPITPPKPSITSIDNYLQSSSITGNQWYNSSGLITGATEQKYYAPANGNYFVKVTSSEGCSSEPSDIFSFTTGIEMNDPFARILIYPNPATDYLTIKNNSLFSSIEFEIMNYNGKIIYNSILINNSIVDIRQFSYGIYYIRFIKGSSYYMFKFIKQ
jgi:hypothetical protein